MALSVAALLLLLAYTPAPLAALEGKRAPNPFADPFDRDLRRFRVCPSSTSACASSASWTCFRVGRAASVLPKGSSGSRCCCVDGPARQARPAAWRRRPDPAPRHVTAGGSRWVPSAALGGLRGSSRAFLGCSTTTASSPWLQCLVARPAQLRMCFDRRHDKSPSEQCASTVLGRKASLSAGILAGILQRVFTGVCSQFVVAGCE